MSVQAYKIDHITAFMLVEILLKLYDRIARFSVFNQTVTEVCCCSCLLRDQKLKRDRQTDAEYPKKQIKMVTLVPTEIPT